MANNVITPASELGNLLSYDCQTGKLFWRTREPISKTDKMMNARNAGKEALTARHKSGYRHGSINGRLYLAHRVVWALHYGAWPMGEIDHINGDKADNRISNLRDVDRSTNCKNKKVRSDNSSGVPGVHYDKAKRKWTAFVSRQGKQTYLGAYALREDAVAARKIAERENGYHENNGRAA